MRRLEPREAEAYQGRNIDPHDDRSKRFINRPFFNRRSAEEGSHRNLARAFWPSVFKVEIELPPPNTPVKVDMAARSLPGLQLLSGLYTPGRMIRTRRLIAEDGNDDFILRINTSGAATVAAAGRKIDYACGAVLTNAAEVSAFDRPSFGGSTVVRIPRSILSALVIDIDDIAMRPIPGETNTLKLLLGYANALLTDVPVGIAARASTPD